MTDKMFGEFILNAAEINVYLLWKRQINCAWRGNVITGQWANQSEVRERNLVSGPWTASWGSSAGRPSGSFIIRLEETQSHVIIAAWLVCWCAVTLVTQDWRSSASWLFACPSMIKSIHTRLHPLDADDFVGVFFPRCIIRKLNLWLAAPLTPLPVDQQSTTRVEKRQTTKSTSPSYWLQP